MQKQLTLPLIAICLILAGCNSSPVYHNLTRSQKPTINADKPVRVFKSIGASHVTDVSATGLGTESPNDDQFSLDPNQDQIFDISFGLDYGVTDDFEVSATILPQGGGKIGIKKVLPVTEAFPREFVHAVAFSAGFQSYDGIYRESSVFDAEIDADLAYSRDAVIADIAYIVGLNLSERVIVYGGPFYTKTQTDTEQESLSIASDNPDSFILHNMTIDSETTGVSFAMTWQGSSGFGVTYELVSYTIDLGEVSDSGHVSSLTLEYNF